MMAAANATLLDAFEEICQAGPCPAGVLDAGRYILQREPLLMQARDLAPFNENPEDFVSRFAPRLLELEAAGLLPAHGKSAVACILGQAYRQLDAPKLCFVSFNLGLQWTPGSHSLLWSRGCAFAHEARRRESVDLARMAASDFEVLARLFPNDQRAALEQGFVLEDAARWLDGAARGGNQEDIARAAGAWGAALAVLEAGQARIDWRDVAAVAELGLSEDDVGAAISRCRLRLGLH